MSKPLSTMHKRVLVAKHTKDGNEKLIDHLKATTDDPQLAAALEQIEEAAMPTTPFWDMAANFYTTTRENVCAVNDKFAVALMEKLDSPQGEELKTNTRLGVLVTSLNSDIEQMITQLDSVFATHSQHRGACKNADEVMQVMNVYGGYSDINEAYFTLINSSVTEIMDIAGLTDDISLAASNQAVPEELLELQNPDVVSDVVFKDTAAESVATLPFLNDNHE